MLIVSKNISLIFLLQGFEAIGESLVISSLLACIRKRYADALYTRNTYLLRIAQNVGLLITTLVGGILFENLSNYASILMYMRLFVVLAIISLIRIKTETKTIKAPNVFEKPKTNIFRLNVILGACSYALFYILVFTPVTIAKSRNLDVGYLGIPMNAFFAIIALLLLYISVQMKLNKHQFKSIRELKLFLINFQGKAVYGIVSITILWTIFLIFDSLIFMLLLGGIFGLFSTANYVLSETGVGIIQVPEKSKNIISFLGYSKFGQIIGIFCPLVIYFEVIGAKTIISTIVLAGAFATVAAFKITEKSVRL